MKSGILIALLAVYATLLTIKVAKDAFVSSTLGFDDNSHDSTVMSDTFDTSKPLLSLQTSVLSSPPSAAAAAASTVTLSSLPSSSPRSLPRPAPSSSSSSPSSSLHASHSSTVTLTAATSSDQPPATPPNLCDFSMRSVHDAMEDAENEHRLRAVPVVYRSFFHYLLGLPPQPPLQCFRNRRILLLGDSTMSETALDMAVALADARRDNAAAVRAFLRAATRQNENTHGECINDATENAFTMNISDTWHDKSQWLCIGSSGTCARFCPSHRNMTVHARNLNCTLQTHFIGHWQLNSSFGGIYSLQNEALLAEVWPLVETADVIVLNSEAHDRAVRGGARQTPLGDYMRIVSSFTSECKRRNARVRIIWRASNTPLEFTRRLYDTMRAQAALLRANASAPLTMERSKAELGKAMHYVNLSFPFDFVVQFDDINYAMHSLPYYKVVASHNHIGPIGYAYDNKPDFGISWLYTQHILRAMAKLLCSSLLTIFDNVN